MYFRRVLHYVGHKSRYIAVVYSDTSQLLNVEYVVHTLGTHSTFLFHLKIGRIYFLVLKFVNYFIGLACTLFYSSECDKALIPLFSYMLVYY